jgi:hypothetical protein
LLAHLPEESLYQPGKPHLLAYKLELFLIIPRIPFVDIGFGQQENV